MFKLASLFRFPGSFGSPSAPSSGGGGGGGDPAYLSDFRTYAAGDIPPGLLPEQYDGIAYLYEPHPQAMVFQ